MEYNRIVVVLMILGACIQDIVSASEHQSCYFCKASGSGGCFDMSHVRSVRCDSLKYSRSGNIEQFNGANGEGANSGNTGNNNGEPGELEPRTNGREFPPGTTFRCVKEIRHFPADNTDVIRRTCVLDQFAAKYCYNLRNNGEANFHDRYNVKECHICDGDSCNIGSSLKMSLGFLLAALSAVVIVRS